MSWNSWMNAESWSASVQGGQNEWRQSTAPVQLPAPVAKVVAPIAPVANISNASPQLAVPVAKVEAPITDTHTRSPTLAPQLHLPVTKTLNHVASPHQASAVSQSQPDALQKPDQVPIQQTMQTQSSVPNHVAPMVATSAPTASPNTAAVNSHVIREAATPPQLSPECPMRNPAAMQELMTRGGCPVNLQRLAQGRQRAKLQIKRLRKPDGTLLRPGTRVPTRANPGDAGCDLYVPQFTTTKPENHHPLVAQLQSVIDAVEALPLSDGFNEQARHVYLTATQMVRDSIAASYAMVPANGKMIIPLGFAASAGVPNDADDEYYLRMAPKSGVAAKQTLDIGAGVGDRTYPEEYGLIVTNYGDAAQLVIAGKSAGQMIMERIRIPEIVEVDELEVTGTRTGGFGSSGAGVGDGSLEATIGITEGASPTTEARTRIFTTNQ